MSSLPLHKILKFLLKAFTGLPAVFFFLGSSATAQPVSWQRSNPEVGLEWLRYDGKINDVRQWINVLLIDTSYYSLTLIANGKELQTLTRLADSAAAIAAINGTFFHTTEGGSVCYTRVNGITTDTTRYNLPSRWFLPQLDDGALVNDSMGWRILPTPLNGWKQTHYRTIISAGPPLILNQQALPLPDHSFSTKRYGRTAIGFTPKGTLVWLTVSGREPASTGFTLAELRQMMLELGCKEALNFDGGSSAAMWIQAATPSGIVSTPGDIPSTIRKIANALVVKLKTNP